MIDSPTSRQTDLRRAPLADLRTIDLRSTERNFWADEAAVWDRFSASWAGLDASEKISVGDIIRRLEGRLTVREGIPANELSPGKVAVHLVNKQLTDATDEVLDQMTLEQLLDYVQRASHTQQAMYYI